MTMSIRVVPLAVMPIKSLICDATMSMATADVNPEFTGPEMKSIKKPATSWDKRKTKKCLLSDRIASNLVLPRPSAAETLRSRSTRACRTRARVRGACCTSSTTRWPSVPWALPCRSPGRRTSNTRRTNRTTLAVVNSVNNETDG